MSKRAPSVYILHGDDQFAIQEEVRNMAARLGESGSGEFNHQHFDGRSLVWDDLVSAVMAMPFLAERRLVVLEHPLVGVKGKDAQQRITGFLANLPQSTALVLWVDHPLTDPRDRGRGKLHWLETWSVDNPGQAFVKEYNIPRGAAMTRWIISEAKQRDGEFSPQAADRLSSMIGEHPRLVSHEIDKLLAFVNYARPVDEQDVYEVTPQQDQFEDFALVNALRDRNGKQALRVLNLMLETSDPLQILGSIVYQYRLLLLARSIIDDGNDRKAVIEQLGKSFRIHPYPAGLASDQAMRYTSPVLEQIYRKLLEIDSDIKRGTDGEVALTSLVVSLTNGS